MPCYIMQTDKNDMKVEKSVSMHSHAFERPCKRQIVTDPKSRKALHVLFCVFETKLNKAVDILSKLSEWIRNIHDTMF